MPDQADRLRQLVETTQQPRSSAPVPLVLVCGGQRGVGTSTVAMQLALASQIAKRRTIVVDASFRDKNYYIPHRGRKYDTLVDVISGGRTVAEVLQSGPHGVQVASAAALPPALSDISPKAWGRIVGQLRGLRSSADLVLIDGGAGASAVNTPLWQIADAVLLISGPQAVSVMDAYAALKAASSRVAVRKLALVMNQAEDLDEAKAAAARIAVAADRFLNIAADVLPVLPRMSELEGDGAAPRRLFKDPIVRTTFGQLAQTVWESLPAEHREHGTLRQAA